MEKTKDPIIDMWYGHKFVPKRFGADAHFYPHGSFGYGYRGNIYSECGKQIGDYASNSSVWIEENFNIDWR